MRLYPLMAFKLRQKESKPFKMLNEPPLVRVGTGPSNARSTHGSHICMLLEITPVENKCAAKCIPKEMVYALYGNFLRCEIIVRRGSPSLARNGGSPLRLFKQPSTSGRHQEQARKKLHRICAASRPGSNTRRPRPPRAAREEEAPTSSSDQRR